MSGAILWCPDAATVAALGDLPRRIEPFRVIERNDEHMTHRDHVTMLVDAVYELREAGHVPEILVGPEAFGWATVGMLRELREWLTQQEELSPAIVVYAGKGASQLGRAEDVAAGISYTTPAVSHGPTMMAPETVIRLGATGACNVADPVGLDWLERYVAGDVDLEATLEAVKKAGAPQVVLEAGEVPDMEASDG